jgi:hypothetical protein
MRSYTKFIDREGGAFEAGSSSLKHSLSPLDMLTMALVFSRISF